GNQPVVVFFLLHYCHSLDGILSSEAIAARSGRGAEHCYCLARFVAGQPKWQGDLPELARGPAPHLPLQERSVGLPGTLFLGTRSQAYGVYAGVRLEARARASFFLRLCFTARARSPCLLSVLEARAVMLKRLLIDAQSPTKPAGGSRPKVRRAK